MNVFALTPPPDSSKRLKVASDLVIWDKITCPLNPDHQRIGRRLTDLAVDFNGNLTSSVLWTWNSDCIISDEFANKMQREHLAGFELRPVQVFSNGGLQVFPKYWELRVTGWGGVAGSNCGIEKKIYCGACGLTTYTCFKKGENLFQIDQWDGSDFFLIWPLPKFIFISEAARSLFEAVPKDDVGIVPSKDLSCKYCLTPGMIEDWFSESRVAQIRARHGIDL